MSLTNNAAVNLIVRSARRYSKDQISIWAAAVAFYAMLSLGPLLFIAISLAGLVVGKDEASRMLLTQIQSIVGNDAARMVGQVISNAEVPSVGWKSTSVAVVTLLLGASGIFSALQDAVNAVWHVRPSSEAGLLLVAKRKALSISMTLSLGFLLMVSIGLTSFFAVFAAALPAPIVVVGTLAEYIGSIALNAALITVIFRLLPDAKVAWAPALVGGFSTAICLVLGKTLIGLYIGQSDVTRPFGAGASLAAILIWIYYAAQILLFGAELTRAYATQFGQKIEPDSDAVRVETKETQV